MTVCMFSSNLHISQVNTNPLTHFTGLRPCHCIFVCICDFALIRNGFMGLGLKGTKVKKPQEKMLSISASVDNRLLTGLTAQQKGTTARWYSNKTSLGL